jgi:multidrug efflux pump subunit AcrA (membrane-fusion protein)
MIRDLSKILFGLVLTAIGLAGGFAAARHGGGERAAAPVEEPGHGDHEGHDDEDGRALSEQTLKNLGVTVGVADLGDFVGHRTVQAVVVDSPLNRRPVFAPLGGVVTSVTARPGTTVLAGAVLVTLARDAIARPKLELTSEILAPVSEDLHAAVTELRSAAGNVRVLSQELVRVRLEPVGAEIGDVVRALERGAALRATPLLRDTGPVLEDLRVRRLATQDGERGSIAYADCPNQSVGPSGTGAARSWRLRSGLRYLVRIPTTTLPRRFVLPAGAVADDGPDRVVFVEHAGRFEKRVVHVEHEDGEVAVVADDGIVKAGERIATSGAFSLSLALQTGRAPVDAHAGHGH